MAYFRCSTGSASSGDGVALVVQCDANFAGSVITATNGTDTFTETCPSVSPYTVRFEGIPTGTYTISGVSQGQTFTTQFTVLDYETTLIATPEGATVLPINDVQIWLHCANIFDKNYTTISEVLADNTSLIILISSNNAVDYMVRSTGFATDVCANQTAMGYIGNNDYCANTLIADATWLAAICSSAYIESVLNVKVPTMTNNTTPSGTCFGTAGVYGSNDYFKSFDGNQNSSYVTPDYVTSNFGIGYDFGSAKTMYVATIGALYTSVFGTPSSYIFQGSNDRNTWTDLTETLSTSTVGYSSTTHQFTKNVGAYSCYRLFAYTSTGGNNIETNDIQFYGR